jgi:hypothetical protein
LPSGRGSADAESAPASQLPDSSPMDDLRGARRAGGDEDIGTVGGCLRAPGGDRFERLYRWRQRLSGDGLIGEARPEFVELRPAGGEPVEVVLRSGRVLRVSTAIDPSALEQLVAILERIGPC